MDGRTDTRRRNIDVRTSRDAAVQVDDDAPNATMKSLRIALGSAFRLSFKQRKRVSKVSTLDLVPSAELVAEPLSFYSTLKGQR